MHPTKIVENHTVLSQLLIILKKSPDQEEKLFQMEKAKSLSEQMPRI